MGGVPAGESRCRAVSHACGLDRAGGLRDSEHSAAAPGRERAPVGARVYRAVRLARTPATVCAANRTTDGITPAST